MSYPKQLPLPRDQLITNVEIMTMTGFNIRRVNFLKTKPLFPKTLYVLPNRTALYKKSAVLEWFERFPQKPQKTRLIVKSDATQQPIFDNQLCVNFLIGKEKTKFPCTGKTTIVHLAEENL